MKITQIKSLNCQNYPKVAFKGEIEKKNVTEEIYVGEQEPGGYIENTETYFIYHPYKHESQEETDSALARNKELSLGSRLPYDEETQMEYFEMKRAISEFNHKESLYF